MKRQIESEAELVNALCKGVLVEFKTEYGNYLKCGWKHRPQKLFREGFKFRYSDPVEVVELWGWKGELSEKTWFEPWEPEGRYTYKQTQIHQNGEIIWTETIKIK
jgi:hypothetical protein